MLWKETRSPGNSSGAETLLFDPRTGKQGQLLRVAPNENFEPVAFSRDGGTLGMKEIWKENGARAKVFDCTTGRLLSTLEASSRGDSIVSLSLSHNGSVAAIATARGLVQLRQSKSGQWIRTLQNGAKGGVVAVAFAPGDRTVAVGEKNGAVRLWSVRKP